MPETHSEKKGTDADYNGLKIRTGAARNGVIMSGNFTGCKETGLRTAGPLNHRAATEGLWAGPISLDDGYNYYRPKELSFSAWSVNSVLKRSRVTAYGLRGIPIQST